MEPVVTKGTTSSFYCHDPPKLHLLHVSDQGPIRKETMVCQLRSLFSFVKDTALGVSTALSASEGGRGCDGNVGHRGNVSLSSRVMRNTVGVSSKSYKQDCYGAHPSHYWVYAKKVRSLCWRETHTPKLSVPVCTKIRKRYLSMMINR